VITGTDAHCADSTVSFLLDHLIPPSNGNPHPALTGVPSNPQRGMSRKNRARLATGSTFASMAAIWA
jgi:hypothetical protein